LAADTTRCPYCHEEVPNWKYKLHAAEHEAPLPDGQQKDHVTLPPEQRFAGSLDEVPTAYHHPTCGVATTMPEEIVRSYLADPFYLSHSTRTFCCGCNEYVPLEEVTWTETGENVSQYIRRLQVEAVRDGRAQAPSMPLGCGVALIGAPLGGLLAALGGWVGGWPGAGVGAVVGLALALAGSMWIKADQAATWRKLVAESSKDF
jgi:hypothetical protein